MINGNITLKFIEAKQAKEIYKYKNIKKTAQNNGSHMVQQIMPTVYHNLRLTRQYRIS
jgi:hypothetical protein